MDLSIAGLARRAGVTPNQLHQAIFQGYFTEGLVKKLALAANSDTIRSGILPADLVTYLNIKIGIPPAATSNRFWAGLRLLFHTTAVDRNHELADIKKRAAPAVPATASRLLAREKFLGAYERGAARAKSKKIKQALRKIP